MEELELVLCLMLKVSQQHSKKIVRVIFSPLMPVFCGCICSFELMTVVFQLHSLKSLGDGAVQF